MGCRGVSSVLVSIVNGDVMKIFIAGASGAIGSHLVPQLVARGHDIVGATRSAAKTGTLRPLGAEPVIVDALDPDSVAEVVAKAEPEVIVHQLTALSGPMKMGNVKRMAAATNRLRTEGTDHLLAAGRAVRVRTFVAQSNYALLERVGGPVADGIALRYGGFYGPGTGIEAAPGAVMAELIRKRKFPIVGGGDGVWSMVHITDAASATVAAIERGRPGIYHVGDDEPAPVREMLLELARALGAKPPR